MKLITQQYQQNKERFSSMSEQYKTLYAIMGMERQWKVYERASARCKWDRREVYRSVLDRLWTAVVTDQAIEEELWQLVEQNDPEQVLFNEPKLMDDKFTYSLIFVQNLKMLIENILDGVDYRELFVQGNFDFLESFLYTYLELDDLENGDEIFEKHELVQAEIEHQNRDFAIIQSKKNTEEIQEWFQENDMESILGNYWFNGNFAMINNE